MLNAESATVPREINIGLPSSSTAVFLDGTKISYGIYTGQTHWAGGNSYTSVGMLDLMESVIRAGQIGVMVNSNTLLGGDRFKAVLTGATSVNGLIRFDGNISGPLKSLQGWSFSMGAYVNLDPTSVNAPCRKYVDDKQVFQAAISRRWQTSSVDLIYRLSLCRDSAGSEYASAPFIYKGDGSVSPMDGFRIGRDCYFPADDRVSYIDVRTGNYTDGRLGEMDRRVMHDISLIAKHRTDSGWDLTGQFHASLMPSGMETAISLAGMEDVAASSLYTAEGKSYTGKVQKRLVVSEAQKSNDAEILFKADRSWIRNVLRSGLSLVYVDQSQAGSSFVFAHSAEASPVRLLRGGYSTWNYNRNSTYCDGHRFQAFLYLIDQWQATDRLRLRTGARFKPVWQTFLTAARLDGENVNIRVEGFNIADASLCTLHKLNKPTFDYSFSEQAVYRLGGGFNAMAEGFYSLTSKGLKYFRNATIPSEKPIGISMARAGVTYDSDWLDFAALFSYIRSWDDALVINVVSPSGAETIPWTAEFGVGTPGLTLDGNLRSERFNMHALFTWQDPRYKDYGNEFKFSDGTVKTIDYTGKLVTGISRVMLELDPSFKWGKYRIWGSARYFSRQYVSRTNLAWFNGHWETFAGADWQVSRVLNLSLNMVNLLRQNGAKGSIDAVDTITDPSLLQGLAISGTYIRPFSIELSMTVKI